MEWLYSQFSIYIPKPVGKLYEKKKNFFVAFKNMTHKPDDF